MSNTNYNAQLQEYYVTNGGQAMPTGDYPGTSGGHGPVELGNQGQQFDNPDTVKITGCRDVNGKDCLWATWTTQPVPGSCRNTAVAWRYAAIGNSGVNWGLPPTTLDTDSTFHECLGSHQELNWTEPSILYDPIDTTLSWAYSKNYNSNETRVYVKRSGPINWVKGGIPTVWDGPVPCAPGPTCTPRTDEWDQILPQLSLAGSNPYRAAIAYYTDYDDPQNIGGFGGVYGTVSTTDDTRKLPAPNPGSDFKIVPFQAVSSQSYLLTNISLVGSPVAFQWFGSSPGSSTLVDLSFTP